MKFTLFCVALLIGILFSLYYDNSEEDKVEFKPLLLPTGGPIAQQRPRRKRPILRRCEKACRVYSREFPGRMMREEGSNDTFAIEFTHVVAIALYDMAHGHFSFDCGGTLISRNFVITAAHCVEDFPIEDVVVRLGFAKVPFNSTVMNREYDIPVKTIIIHEEYNRRFRENDVALLELEEGISKDFVTPACLRTDPKVPKELMVAGWGILESRTRSPVLVTTDMFPISHESCRTILDYKISPDHFCCVNEGLTRCVGDSGGPIHYHDREAQAYYLVGVTAYAFQCGSRMPGIYTKVSSYLDWIEEHVWKS